METSGDRSLTRPAHATVIAYLALFVALGGTATALNGKNSVTSDDIKRGNVRTSDIARGAVKRNKIANRAVNARRLAPRSVTTSRLVPQAVVNRILAGDAVTSDKILDLTIGSNDVARDAIGSGKIARNSVGGSELKPDSVGTNKLLNGAVDGAKLADGSVTATKIGAGQIPIGKLSSPVVAAGEPFVAGLGGPVLEFVKVSTGAGPIATIPGIGTYTGGCSGGATVTYTNAGSDNQQVIVDDGTAGGITADPSLMPGETAPTPAIAPAMAVHVTIFSHRENGASAHAEIFATEGGGACSFYFWAISR